MIDTVKSALRKFLPKHNILTCAWAIAPPLLHRLEQRYGGQDIQPQADKSVNWVSQYRRSRGGNHDTIDCTFGEGRVLPLLSWTPLPDGYTRIGSTQRAGWVQPSTRWVFG